MSTPIKLMLANALMSVGALPLVVFVVWLSGVLGWTPGHRAIIPMIDPLGLLGLFALSYLFTAAVAGTSAAWSWDLVRASPQNRSRLALGLRLTTAALLISPFALIFLAQFL